jgi:type VI secretion system protein ImpJ
MTTRAVHWHEGMFLRPHHFQLADRYATHLLHRQVQWSCFHSWGLRRCVIDADALAAFRFLVRSLEVRLRDGTTIALPEEGAELSADVKSAFAGRSRVDVYLAVPQWRSGQANASADGSPARYRVDTQPLDDENTGTNPQPVSLRSLNVRLLLSGEEQAGFEAIPLARLEKSERAEATPRIDPAYIPPVLCCDAWPVLQQDILQQVFFRLNKKVEVLAAQVKSRGISFDSGSPGDARRMAQLGRMNEAHALLGNLAFVPGIHPLDAYLELCRLVGQLAIFGEEARPPELPRYDHDDLGGCFWRLKHYLDALLNEVDEPAYQERPFIGAGLRMQVTMEPAWMEPAWQMFIGVRSDIAGEECVRLLMRPEKLGMKVGSSDRVDTIFTRGQEGLRFTPAPRPPRDLPSGGNLTYFEISRESATNEWAHVQKTLSLALRLQERDVVSNIQGQRELTIRVGAQTATFTFTLYVVPTNRPGG